MRLETEQLEVMEAVAHLFHSVLMNGPEPEAIALLQQQGVVEQWPDFGNTGRRTETGLQLLADFMASWDGSDAAMVALKLDFGRLFLGPGEPMAPPWGSVYLDAAQLLNSESTMAFAHFLRHNGIRIDQKTNEPLDHIGTQFAVLSFLLQQQGAQPSATGVQSLSRRFLTEHMLPWADRCLELAEGHAQTDYYRGLAILAREYLLTLRRAFDIHCVAVPLFR